MVTGTLRDLREVRRNWRALAPAAVALYEMGLKERGDELAALCQKVGAAEFGVHTPCLACHRVRPVAVTIGDPHGTEPSMFLCRPCSDRIDDDAEALRNGPA